MFSHRDIALYTLTKSLWSLGGGVLLLLTLFGRQIFPLGVDGALSIGLLYAARGVGAGIGPLLARRLGGDGEQFLRRAIGPAIVLTGVGYTLVSGAPSLLLAALGVMIAHIGGSTQWVFSTSLLADERAQSPARARLRRRRGAADAGDRALELCHRRGGRRRLDAARAGAAAIGRVCAAGAGAGVRALAGTARRTENHPEGTRPRTTLSADFGSRIERMLTLAQRSVAS